MRTWMGTVITAAAGGAADHGAAARLRGAADARRGRRRATRRWPRAASSWRAPRPGARSARGEIYARAAPAVVSVARARAARRALAVRATGAAGRDHRGLRLRDRRGAGPRRLQRPHGRRGRRTSPSTLADGRTRARRGRSAATTTRTSRCSPSTPTGSSCTALELGRRRAAWRSGDPTLALGKPGGGPPTLTTGVVSAPGRRLVADGGFALDGVDPDGRAAGPPGTRAGRCSTPPGGSSASTAAPDVGGAVGRLRRARATRSPQVVPAARGRRAACAARSSGIRAEARTPPTASASAACAAGSPAERGRRARRATRVRAPRRRARRARSTRSSRVLAGREPGERVALAADRAGRTRSHSRRSRLADRPAAAAER